MVAAVKFARNELVLVGSVGQSPKLCYLNLEICGLTAMVYEYNQLSLHLTDLQSRFAATSKGLCYSFVSICADRGIHVQNWKFSQTVTVGSVLVSI